MSELVRGRELPQIVEAWLARARRAIPLYERDTKDWQFAGDVKRGRNSDHCSTEFCRSRSKGSTSDRRKLSGVL